MTAISGIFIWAFSNGNNNNSNIHNQNSDTTQQKIDTSKVLVELDRYYLRNAKYDDTLELSDFNYDQLKKSIELKIRNTSRNTALITKVRLSIFPSQHVEFGFIKKADTFILNIDRTKQQKTYDNKQYLYLDQFYDIDYKIDANDVARIAFILNFDLSKFYNPQVDGSYLFKLTLYYNKTHSLLFDGYLKNDSIIGRAPI